MIKFIKKHSNKLYVIGSIILLLMIGIVGVLIGSEYTKRAKAAPETWELTINKTSTVTVYVSGKGVTPNKEKSNENVDVYNIEKGTGATLRAVNESRIFDQFKFDGDFTLNYGSAFYVDSGGLAYITPSSDVDVTIQRKDASASHFGYYMNSRFTINLEIHLIYLQRIFDAGNDEANIASKDVLDAYDYFFEKERTYESLLLNNYDNNNETDRQTKAKQIVSLGYFSKIQYGYYQVNSSFSLMDSSFTGIGSTSTPFQGVLCGKANDTISTIFVTTSGNETSGDMYRGLFKAIGEYAVIRNINIRTSIGISSDSQHAASNIYVGGIAGSMTNSVLSNVDVLARISVDATRANIYAGGIAGTISSGGNYNISICSGIDSNRNIKINGKDSTFILTTNASNTNIYAGLITGDATDVYVKEANCDVTNFAVSAKNTVTMNAGTEYSSGTNIYIGNLFGKYTATELMPIENVKINGTSKETLSSLISNGNSYIGGLIGHLTVNDARVELGDVQFNITSGESKFSAFSVDANSRTNLLTAGLIASVVGDNLYPREEFLDGVVEKTVDNETRYEYNYIFNTNLKIESTNHGKMDGSTFGKVISTGFIARGYMNLNGASNTDRNEILLTSGKYQTKIYATQSSTTRHTSHINNNGNSISSAGGSNDKEHCVATAFYGNIVKTNYTISNLNVYAANYDVAATRELGSFGKSDVHAAGLIGYTLDTTLENISLYLNDSYIKGHSLSYEVTNTTDYINNTYVGGIVGSVNDRGYNTYRTYSNITFAGNYDHLTKATSGTTTKVEGIQNTVGNANYRNENYVGGMFGRTYRTHFEKIYYIGSPSDEDSIISLGHEDPATAFCGGIIGYIYNENLEDEISVSNVEITDANVYLGATVVNVRDNQPDVYIGGIVGSIFHANGSGGWGQNAWESSIDISNARVVNTNIVAEGNEYVMIFAGGIIASAAWGGSINVNDSYVLNSNIESHLKVSTSLSATPGKPNDWGVYSCAAGIVGRAYNNVYINNSVVIDTNITSSYINTYDNQAAAEVSSSGLHGQQDTAGTVNFSNCYSNAKLTSTYQTTTTNNSGHCFGIIDSSIGDTMSNVYYVSQNVGDSNNGTSDGTALDFSDKTVATSVTRLFDNLELDGTRKYYINLYDKTNFSTGTTSNHVGVKANYVNKASFADIWINAKINGDSNSKNPSNYTSEAALIEAGWFNLGSLIVKNGSVSAIATLTDTNYSYLSDSKEYVKVGNSYHNINDADDKITYVPYVITPDGSNTLVLSSGTVESLSTVDDIINVYVTQNMMDTKLSFKFNPSSYVPAIFDNEGNLVSLVKTDNNNTVENKYGKFTYSVNTTTNDYVVIFEPSENFDKNETFYLGLVSVTSGNVTIIFDQCYQFNIFGATSLVGAIYADYTKPINYQYITYNNNVKYLVRAGTITKIIPVFERTATSEILVSELNISKVTFSSTAGTMKSNGEITAPNSGEFTVTLTYTENGVTSTVSINFQVVTINNVSYSAIGADIEGLNYATGTEDYILDFILLDHYGGYPDQFDVKIGNTTYSLNNVITNKWIYVQDQYGNWQQASDWDIEYTKYRLIIPQNSVNADITITAVFPVAYTITFDLQTDSFYPDYQGDKVITFKAKIGSTLSSIFGGENNPKMAILNNATGPETSGGARRFGYVFSGFYLIDNGNSLAAYSTSFEDLLKNYGNLQIQSSYMYYARWSFLIELIEAPGTEIKTSFESGFMEDVGLTQEEKDKLQLNNMITIPINNNRGYVFTVEKEEGYIGEAQVKAYIVNQFEHNGPIVDGICQGCGKPVDQVSSENVTEIEIEKYHDNMYLYYIPPEKITGYLVIVSSVTNSSIIVGKNTASVTEQILPEDGIYTFKYVVNHRKNESYIYDTVNNKSLLSLKRDINIQFYDQVYDPELKTTEVQSRNLIAGTTIEVYYSLYEDGALTKQIIGVYTAVGGEQSIRLNSFKTWDQQTQAFVANNGVAPTFAEIVKNNIMTSEVYYFVVTPPNGQNTGFSDTGNEIINEVIYVGYCDEEGNYISGSRTDQKLDNIPIEDYIDGIANIESSLQAKIYSVTPSRQTELVQINNNTYTFTDLNTYHVVDLEVSGDTPTLTAENRLVLNDSGSKNTVVTSSFIKGRIRELKLVLGYNTGYIKIYGAKSKVVDSVDVLDDTTWSLIETIYVSKDEYTEYIIDFERLSLDYSFFRIDNTSEKEIRLESFKYVTASNAMEYSFTISEGSVSGNSISFINQIKGDTRHDGKSFMLAVEYSNLNVNGISTNVSITVNDKVYYPLLETRAGKVVAYYNLTAILKTEGSNIINIKLNNDNHTLERVRLLEATSALKPAVSEERVVFPG